MLSSTEAKLMGLLKPIIAQNPVLKLETGIAKHCLGAKIVVYACL